MAIYSSTPLAMLRQNYHPHTTIKLTTGHSTDNKQTVKGVTYLCLPKYT